MFYLQEGFTYRNFLMDALAIFIFVVWFRLLITVFADLFPSPRHFRLDQGYLGNSIDRHSIHCHPCIFDLSRKRHGRAQCSAGSAGA